MARIKVTGYLNVEDLGQDEVDLGDKTGLSEKGFLSYNSELTLLEDLDFELVGDEDD